MNPSLSDAKRLALQYIEEHRFLADYIKPLAKEIVIKHFQSMSTAIGALELAVRRTEHKKLK